jgi:hypothetical protein
MVENIMKCFYRVACTLHHVKLLYRAVEVKRRLSPEGAVLWSCRRRQLVLPIPITNPIPILQQLVIERLSAASLGV